MALPPCGLYRTTRALDHVPAGRLVFFHNHGDPGPGIYLPSGWVLNRARWHERGHTIPSPEWAASLAALPPYVGSGEGNVGSGRGLPTVVGQRLISRLA